MVFLMLLFSVDYYLVAKIQRISETTKFKIKNNTRDTQNVSEGQNGHFVILSKCHLGFWIMVILYNYI